MTPKPVSTFYTNLHNCLFYPRELLRNLYFKLKHQSGDWWSNLFFHNIGDLLLIWSGLFLSGAFTREVHNFTRENGAFTREFYTFTRELLRIPIFLAKTPVRGLV
jgi:superfamily I DNA and RNA helicase